MATHYGKNIDVEIYGGSHDDKIGVVIKGLPVGFAIDYDELLSFMARRAPGQDNLSTARKEPDIPVFLEGVSEDNVITSDTVHAVIYNKNQRSSDYPENAFIPRPSHADYAAIMKYGQNVDLRGGGHFSGRLTACMCIAGGICMQLLNRKGIYIGAHLYSVGSVNDSPFDPVNISEGEIKTLLKKDFPVISDDSTEKIKKEILDAASDKDSVGGVIECAAVGIPAGIGEHIFSGVESRLASVLFSIPAVKGVEFGNGFACANLRGSINNDAFFTDGKKVYTGSNNCGGILGGITNGMPVIFRVAMKPTPSIFKEQDSVDLRKMENVKLSIKGRHDPCVVRRAVPVVEAACALAITDMIFDND